MKDYQKQDYPILIPIKVLGVYCDMLFKHIEFKNK